MTRFVLSVCLSLALILPVAAPIAASAGPPPVALTNADLVAHDWMGCHRRVVPGPCCHAGPDVYHCH